MSLIFDIKIVYIYILLYIFLYFIIILHVGCRVE